MTDECYILGCLYWTLGFCNSIYLNRVACWESYSTRKVFILAGQTSINELRAPLLIDRWLGIHGTLKNRQLSAEHLGRKKTKGYTLLYYHLIDRHHICYGVCVCVCVCFSMVCCVCSVHVSACFCSEITMF